MFNPNQQIQQPYVNVSPSAPMLDDKQLLHQAPPPPPSYDQANYFSSSNNHRQQNAQPFTSINQQPQTDTNALFKEQRFRNILNKHEISLFFSQKLQSLSSFKIVFIFDDSGSMCTTLEDSPLNNGLLKATRWQELQAFANISIEIANIFNENGSDIHFLNRPPARNIMEVTQLGPYFFNKPAGYTPLTRVFDSVLNENRHIFLQENKLLVIIVTDGEPTNDNGQQNINEFKRSLTNRHKNVFVTIVSCTDDDQTMRYLDNWDRMIPNLDVVDDFRTERQQILKIKGAQFRFSFGDYVVKSLVGSIHSSLDKLDEKTVNNCCSIT